MSGGEEIYSIVGKCIAECIKRQAHIPDASMFHKLTPELVEHLKKMDAATDWNEIDIMTVNIVDDLIERLDEHIGEYVKFNIWGDTIDDPFSLDAFCDGTVICLEDDYLNVVASDWSHFSYNEPNMMAMCDIVNYVALAIQNGKNEKEILRDFKKELRNVTGCA